MSNKKKYLITAAVIYLEMIPLLGLFWPKTLLDLIRGKDDDWTDEDFAREFPADMDLCPSCGIQQTYPHWVVKWFSHKRECPVFIQGLADYTAAEKAREARDLKEWGRIVSYEPDAEHGGVS